MSGDSNIAETLKEDVAEMAKAVAADVKAIAAEVAEAVAEGKAELCGDATTEAAAADPAPAVPPRAAHEGGTGGTDEQK